MGRGALATTAADSGCKGRCQMNGKEYLTVQMTMIEIGKKLEKLDLDAFLKCISNAETMAPMLDPTLYRQAAANLDAIKKLAHAFQTVKTEFAKVQETVTKTTVAYMTQRAGLPHEFECEC